MTIAVMGAGAVGAYHGALLARAGHAVTLIGRPAHVDAVRAHGLRLQTATLDVQVPLAASTSPEAARGAGLVLVCVKSGDTEAAADALRPHLGADTLVLSLQNGVDNAARLRARLAQPVGAAVVYVATEMAGPGHVRHHGRGELLIEPAPGAAAVAAIFTAAGIPTTVSEDVQAALWSKLTLNCAYNALSALARQPYGRLVQAPGVAAVMRDVVAECRAVAAAEGVRLPAELDASVAGLAATMPGQFSSTAQDLMRGRRSEIDHLNGLVVRRGEAHGVPTPANRVLHTLVRLVEDAAG
ncbi:ketopantoate reductase family protein [Piscinibacter sakaiensis]|uniref:2-dehydropantoate 2-reductase n=1 Tax=Piscinibacter sakaiensis TaxID=1547922 RepID=A0A0K8P476_PISS1|nr:2-dehydropantoate 2-reductase [Piscinibacter sakaiensis]GAP37442.1 2-dehydropantoate 2-reductase [Piscinibacter sakaiensis]